MEKKRKREDGGDDEGSYGDEGDVDEKHESESSSEEDSLASGGQDDDFVGGGGVGVGGGGGKIGKGKGKKGSSSKSNVSSASTKRFTKEDDEWAKDLPPGFTENHKDWYDALSVAIDQGHLKVCWAVAIARCIQALYAIKNVRVELSPQHLINNIVGKSKSGDITKYEELSNFLKNHGLVLEDACKFTGQIGETCSKECTCQTSEESVYKIKEFNFIEQKDLKEEDVLEMVKLGPVVAFIDDYASLHKYKSGIYKGPLNRKDMWWGLHAVVVYGFGTTEQGEHYWLVQNSWSDDWGEKGLGKIIRKCSRNKGESSLLVNVIHMTV